MAGGSAHGRAAGPDVGQAAARPAPGARRREDAGGPGGRGHGDHRRPTRRPAAPPGLGRADLRTGTAPRTGRGSHALLPRLSSHEVEHVVRAWDPDPYTRAATDVPVPPVPQELFDALLEACLTPLAAYLLHPEPEEGWAQRTGRWTWPATAAGRCWPGAPSSGRSSSRTPRSGRPSSTCCWTRPRPKPSRTPGYAPLAPTLTARNPPPPYARQAASRTATTRGERETRG